MTEEGLRKAKTLIEALPYIRRFKGHTVVVKYGGSLMFDEEVVHRFCKDMVLLKYVGINPIVVHGGGKEISRWLEKVGKETTFVDGLRVTDAETMEITEMVLSGKVNSNLVSIMNQCGGKAVGLSGKDAHLFTADIIRSKDDQDLGLVGEICEVNSDLLNTLTEDGYIPVITSVAVTKDGTGVNTNADEAAAAVASELKASKLFFMTDVDGVQTDGKLHNFLELKDAEKLREHSDVTGGMIPKLGCSVNAIKRGVDSVHIVNGACEHVVLLEVFTDSGIGTMIRHKRVPG